MYKNIFLFFLFALSLTIQAQQPVSIHLSEKEGLPDVEFYDVIEDNEGYIWLAADKGLYRYDGKTFKKYTHPQKRGLSVFHLKKDSEGKIWCNNLTGQFFFIEKDKMELFVDIQDKVQSFLPRYAIDNEKLSITTQMNVYGVDLKTKEITELNRFKKISNTIGIVKNENKLFYISGSKVYDENSKVVFKNFEKELKGIYSVNNSLYVISSKYRPERGFYNSKVFLFNSKTKQFKKQDYSRYFVEREIIKVVDLGEFVWFCTNRGVLQFYKSKNGLVYKQTLLENEFVTSSIKDSNGNHWFSTISNGFFIYPNLNILKYDLPKNLQKISALEKIENYLIFGTYTGEIGIINIETNEISSTKLMKSRVCDFAYDEKNQLIYISQDYGSFIWDLNKKNVYRSKFFTTTKTISVSEKGELLVSGSGVSSIVVNPLIEEKNKKEQRQITIPNYNRTKRIEVLSTILRGKRTYGHIYTSKKKLYTSFVDGIYYGDIFKEKQEVTLEGKSIYGMDFTETIDQTIWISTFNNGIVGIVDDKIKYTLNKEKGLLTNSSSKLINDNNNLIIVTDLGVQYYDREKNKIRTLILKDELSILTATAIVNDEKNIYISGNNGIVKINKAYVINKSKKPQVYFTSIQIKDNKTAIDSVYHLDYKTNSIQLTFNSNGFKSEEKIKYKYRLKNLEKNWTTTATGIARYPLIPYGNFTFEVKAEHQDGTEGDVQRIQIITKKPFWLQWWFYLLIFIGFCCYLYIKFKSVLKRQKELVAKEKVEKELILSQLENLRSQMNPHFVFNALNSIQEYIYLNEKYNASMYLSKFSKLIRTYLNHSRNSEVLLKEELNALQLYLELEKDRFEDELLINLKIDENIDINEIFIPSLFIQPYIENALKHGLFHKKGAKELCISFQLNTATNSIECLIVDNGIGRDAAAIINKKRSKIHKPFFSMANKNRIQLLNNSRTKKIAVKIRDLYDKKQNSLGTEVLIIIPL